MGKRKSAGNDTVPLSKPQLARVDIATLNLFNFLAPPAAAYEFDRIYSNEQWQKKCNWLRHCVTSLEADIIGFQEVFSVDELKALMQELGYPHFAVVDTPGCEDYVCRSPVVAIASRLPLAEVAAVEPDPAALAAMDLNADFRFGRRVLRATVSLDDWGMLDIYVLHFKSQRPLFEPEALGDMKAAPRLLAHRALGSFASSARRGFEAMLLYQALINRRDETANPMVIMGDFNSGLDAAEFRGFWLGADAIHGNDRQVAGLGGLSEQAFSRAIGHFALKDASVLFLESQLFERQGGGVLGADSMEDLSWARRPTHYLGSRGSLLDHILLSQDFDGALAPARGRVCHFSVFDEHLRSPVYERDSESSDHAALVVGLELL
ncbi:endonuclease/exonuclease/phosphatase family protein [Shewanella litorisediminis]|uniref:Endonuclease/exonuclease/phosphatase family protein n=1 Tax=Shewanella litorisediminis TaxID=1173586 RepID=A0ABX7G1P9_9GAMM|nr:endonuclease/exonuclease/phosphatase family protein [Shewanella litorisediminis]MCL2918359.1 endonuclease/exonuclease/phosphatase family protein [Shewanella litorisediminis]QRH01198.1 endonuclease/exonuclease/phosphatase family protein [Shewanella litorisediminis]